MSRRAVPPSVLEPSPEELRAKADRRRRGLAVSTFCLHAMTWILIAFYSTDYLPPLAVRSTVGLGAPHLNQYLVGYAALAGVCVLLGGAFGWFYRARLAASRYRWRWVLFPAVVAVLLIPAQGANEWLSRLVELACLIASVWGGAAFSPRPGRRWRAPAVRREDAS